MKQIMFHKYYWTNYYLFSWRCQEILDDIILFQQILKIARTITKSRILAWAPEWASLFLSWNEPCSAYPVIVTEVTVVISSGTASKQWEMNQESEMMQSHFNFLDLSHHLVIHQFVKNTTCYCKIITFMGSMTLYRNENSRIFEKWSIFI